MTGRKKTPRTRLHRKALKLFKRVGKRHAKAAAVGTLAITTLSLQPVQNALQEVRASGELHLVGISSPSTFYHQDGHTHGLQY